MIGESDGYTTETATLSLNNPFIERYVELINSLKPINGGWGITLDKNEILESLNENQINEYDYNFLVTMMFKDGEGDYEVSLEDEAYSHEFYVGVCSETEYSYLTFEGAELFYYDEYNHQYETEIVKNILIK